MNIKQLATEAYSVRPKEPGGEFVAVSEIIRTLLDSKWLILSITCLFLFFGFLYLIFTQPIYSSDLVMQIEQREDPQTGSELGENLTAYGAVNPVSAEVEVLRSRLVLGAVVDELDLDIEVEPRRIPLIGAALARWHESHSSDILDPYEFLSLFKVWDLREFFTGFLQINQFAWGGEDLAVEIFEIPSKLYGDVFIVTALADNEFRLDVKDATPILEGKVGERITVDGDRTGEKFSIVISSLKARPGTQFELTRFNRSAAIKDIERKLGIRERGSESGILKLVLSGDDPEKVSQTLNKIGETFVRQNVARQVEEIEKNLGYLEAQLPLVKAELDINEEQLNAFRMDRGSVDLTVQTRNILERILAIETELRVLTQRRGEMRLRFTDAHPSVIAIDAQFAQLREELKLLEAEIAGMPDTQQKVLRLNRNVEVNTALYTALLSRTQGLKIAKSGTVGNVRILDEAITSGAPVKPLRSVSLVLAGTLGGLLGLVAPFIRKAMSPGVEDPEILERHLNLPVYAMIPHSKRQKTINREADYLHGEVIALARLEPNDIAIESLRNLRSALYFSETKANSNIIFITSPSPRVGKSFVSLNLAAVLADSGKKVLLIDADMRRGRLHNRLSVPQDPGLSEAILTPCTPESTILQTDIENLSFIPTGLRPSNPSELLLSDRFESLLRLFSSRFDYVILDGAPVLAAADAGILGHLAGATLLVIKSGSNPFREIEQSKKRLLQSSVNLTGAIVNDIKMNNKSRSYDGYVYQYDYDKE